MDVHLFKRSIQDVTISDIFLAIFLFFMQGYGKIIKQYWGEMS